MQVAQDWIERISINCSEADKLGLDSSTSDGFSCREETAILLHFEGKTNLRDPNKKKKESCQICDHEISQGGRKSLLKKKVVAYLAGQNTYILCILSLRQNL